MFKWIPKTLALIAVQRHTAASRSTRPSMRLQQGNFGGPTTRCTKPFNTSAHAPNFNVSLGHVAGLEGLGLGSAGLACLGWCLWPFFSGGGQATLVEVTKVKKRRLRERRRAVEARALEAIWEIDDLIGL
ncbi:hypothetical protein ACE6H2_016962 [Prunus campanulata]